MQKEIKTRLAFENILSKFSIYLGDKSKNEERFKRIDKAAFIDFYVEIIDASYIKNKTILNKYKLIEIYGISTKEIEKNKGELDESMSNICIQSILDSIVNLPLYEKKQSRNKFLKYTQESLLELIACLKPEERKPQIKKFISVHLKNANEADYRKALTISYDVIIDLYSISGFDDTECFDLALQNVLKAIENLRSKK